MRAQEEFFKANMLFASIISNKQQDTKKENKNCKAQKLKTLDEGLPLEQLQPSGLDSVCVCVCVCDFVYVYIRLIFRQNQINLALVFAQQILIPGSEENRELIVFDGRK